MTKWDLSPTSAYVQCKRCGKSVPDYAYRRGSPSRWVSTGQEWVNQPIPVFRHGSPTMCHPAPMGMVPNGYWRDTGYWTSESTWAPGRPTSEEGCPACAEVVQEAATAHNAAQTAKRASDEALANVVEAAAADVDAPLDEFVRRYADAEVERVAWDERRDHLGAEVSAQDRRAKAATSAVRASAALDALEPRTPRPADAVRAGAEAFAREKAEGERIHQRLVNGHRARFGDAEMLRGHYEHLERFCTRAQRGLPRVVLIACMAVGVAIAVLMQRAADWVPGIVDAVRYSSDIREALSVPLGAVLGIGLFGVLSAGRRASHRHRVASAEREASQVRERVGCGSPECQRCRPPRAFRADASTDTPDVTGTVVLAFIALAIYMAIAVGDRSVKLQRVGAVVPERIREDCTQRDAQDGPVELVCDGPRVRAIGLRRVYFQFGNPSYDTYGKGVFQDATAFRGCAPLRTSSDRGGGWASCTSGAGAWTDEEVVLGGAIGTRAVEFARLQHRYGGERVYPR